MSKPFFMMNNNHSSSCGTPPVFSNNETNKYYGYFENEHREQWIFIYDRKTGIAELRGGDVGWETAYQVKDGNAAEIILNAEEKKWLCACWKAATAFIL